MTAPARPDPIPDSYRRVTPCLTVQGAGKALEFYAAVFGATERMRAPGPGGTIMHAEIEIGDSVVMVEDENPRRGTKAPPPGGLPGFPAYLFIYVENVDAVIVTGCLAWPAGGRPRREYRPAASRSWASAAPGHRWALR